MPTEELKFEELLKEYVDVIESTDVKELKESNKIAEIDINRKQKEVADVDARIEQIQAELDSLNENPTVRLEYPETIKDKEDKLQEANDFKAKKNEEINKLKDQIKENKKKITKANTIGKKVIKKAEEQTNKENEEIDKKIAELEERKAKYGLKQIDKDGKETIQLTKEEKVVVAGIKKEIRELRNQKAQNLIALKNFKDFIAKVKKDKEAYRELKDRVNPPKEEVKEEPVQEESQIEPKEEVKEEAAQEDPQVEEKEEVKDEPAQEEPQVEPKEEVKDEPQKPQVAAKKETKKQTISAKEETKEPQSKIERIVKEQPAPVEEKSEQVVEEPVSVAEEPVVEEEQVVEEPVPVAEEPIVEEPTPVAEEPVPEVEESIPVVEETIPENADTYETTLNEYKEMLSMYKDAVLVLGDLQQQYENGEIDYSVYEEQALYVADRYKFMMQEYAKVKDLHDKEMIPEDRFAGLTNENLENQLKELDEEANELWQQGVHENTPDAKRYHEILEEIKRIKEELQQRKENPLRGMSLEELEARRRELYAKIGEQQEPDEYEFRTHKENGLEGYEEDYIDKGLKEIREEIERRQPKKVEAPEKPVKVGILDKDIDVGVVPPAQKQEVEVEKTGLQIFREQLHEMPEIKNRHTASERVKIAAPIGVTAGVLSLGMPMVGIPLMLGSMVAAPLVARLTGQKKLEKQIEEQFSEMSEEEFNKMMDYLTEERITELKPNAVILKALHRESLRRTQEEEQRLTDEFQEIETEKQEIIARLESGKLTKEEADILLAPLNEDSKRVGADAEITQKRLKDIQRGKDRVSAAYKGNLITRFNIFARRNTSTEKYLPVIDELADAELERDTATAMGENTTATLADRRMQGVMAENTYTNKLGIQRSILNGRKNPVKIISDRKDNTVRNVCTAAIITTGLIRSVQQISEIEQAQQANQAQWNNQQQAVDDLRQSTQGITQSDAQLASDGIVTEAIGKGEAGALNTDETFGNIYDMNHATMQGTVDNLGKNSQINPDTPSGLIDQLIDKHKAARSIDVDFEKTASMAGQYAGHSTQERFISNAVSQKDGEIGFLEGVKKVIEKVENIKDLPAFQSVKLSLLGPIQTAIGGIMARSKERQENREARKNLEAVQTNEER